MRHDHAVTLAKSIDAALLLLDDVRAATATGAKNKIKIMTALRGARLLAWEAVGDCAEECPQDMPELEVIDNSRPRKGQEKCKRSH